MSIKLPWGLTAKDVFTALVAPLISCVVTAGLTILITVTVLDGRAQSEKETQSFRIESTAFEAVTANYVQHILDDRKPDSAATEQLMNNLFAQQRYVDNVAKHLPTKDYLLASEYHAEVGTLIRIIPTIQSVDAMRPFWEEVSKILVLRNKVLNNLPA